MQKFVNCSLILCVHRSVLLRPWGEWCVSVCYRNTSSECMSVCNLLPPAVCGIGCEVNRKTEGWRERKRKKEKREEAAVSMTEFWVCFSCCIGEQPQPVSTHTQEITVLFTPDLSVYEVWTLKVKVLDTEIEPGFLIFCTSYQPVCECLFIKQLTVVAFSNTTISLMLYRRGGGG